MNSQTEVNQQIKTSFEVTTIIMTSVLNENRLHLINTPTRTAIQKIPLMITIGTSTLRLVVAAKLSMSTFVLHGAWHTTIFYAPSYSRYGF